MSSPNFKSLGLEPGPALVTGASSGIGRAFAQQMAGEGFELILVARRQKVLEELADELERGGASRPIVLVADLGTDEGQQSVLDCIAQRPLKVLVNSAGFTFQGPFAEQDTELERVQLKVFVEATMRTTHAALTGMLKAGNGLVINVSSRAAFRFHPGLATYAAGKAWATSFTRALAEELRGSGVRAFALCPGNTRTGFHERAGIDPEWGGGQREPEFVVRSALQALQRGEAACAPGERGAWLRRLLPDGLALKLSGILRRIAWN